MRFADEQSTLTLHALQDVVTVQDVCRRFRVTEQTFYRWKRDFGAMMPSEIKRQKLLEDENQRLRSIVADLTLYKQMLQDVLRTHAESFAPPGRDQDSPVRPRCEQATCLEGVRVATELIPVRQLH
jgi:putative transposase